MELKTSEVVKIQGGTGILQFPEALKREPLRTQIRCISICLKPDKTADNGPIFIVCTGSYYMNKSRQMKRNVLGMLTHTPSGGLTHFTNNPMPITLPQESFDIEVIDIKGSRKNVDATVVFEIQGFVSNRNLAI